MRVVKSCFLLGASSCCLLICSSAQKQKSKVKTDKVTDTLPPKPPKNLPPGVEIDTAKLGDLEEKKIDVAQPTIDFDTTSVPDDDLTKAIRKYFDATHSIDQATELIRVVYESEDMKQILPEDFRVNFIKSYEKGNVGYKYLELLTLKSYRKYYTVKDMEQMLQFYQSPLGQKMISVMPMLLKDNTIEGQKLGKWVATQIK